VTEPPALQHFRRRWRARRRTGGWYTCRNPGAWFSAGVLVV
jgi:hypothetical protein